MRLPALRPWCTVAVPPRVACRTLVISLLASSGCNRAADASGSSLALLGPVRPAVSGLPYTRGSSMSTGEMIVCVRGRGTVVLDGVEPDHPEGGFHVVDFALRPNPSLTHGYWLGGAPGDLRTAGFPAERATSQTCKPGTGAGSELGVTLMTAKEAAASTRGFRIRWHSGDRSGTLRFPLAVMLCPGPTADRPECDTHVLLVAV